MTLHHNYSLAFKRILIRKIKEYPNVWPKKMKLHEDWKSIQNEMTGIEGDRKEYSLELLYGSWATLRAVYFRKIFIRTIERNFEAPKWPLFHEMSFLYEYVKEKIQNKLGGISPPIFKAKQKREPQCPCCVYIGINKPTAILESSTCSTDTEPEAWIANNLTEEKTHEYQDLAVNNVPQTSEALIDLPEAQENMACNSTLNPTFCYIPLTESTLPVRVLKLYPEIPNGSEIVPVQNLEQQRSPEGIGQNKNSPETTEWLNVAASILGKPSSQELAKDKPVDEVIELIDDDEIVVGSSNVSQTPTPTYNTNNTSFTQQLQRYFVKLNKPNASVTPKQVVPTTNSVLEEQPKIPIVQPKPIDSNPTKPNQVNFNAKIFSPNELILSSNKAIAERAMLIEAIKANPDTYTRTRSLAGWDKVSQAVNNVAIPNLKTRWRILKNRYLKELVGERYGSFKSRWEHYHQMEFYRQYMQHHLDEIHKTRVEIQDAVNKKNPVPIEVRNSSPLPTATTNVNSSSPNPEIQPNLANKGVAYVNENQGLQISHVESMSSMNEPSIQNSMVLDPSKMPILQNRPIKIMAVQAIPSLDLTNDDDDENETNGIPPVKRLRQSTENGDKGLDIRLEGPIISSVSSQNNTPKLPDGPIISSVSTGWTPESNETQNATVTNTSKFPAGPIISSVSTGWTPDPNESRNAPVKNITQSTAGPLISAVSTGWSPDNNESQNLPAKNTAKRTTSQNQPPSKVYPPLDLTLDDDELNEKQKSSELKPSTQTKSASNYQEAFVKTFVDNEKLFAKFDVNSAKSKEPPKTSNTNGLKNGKGDAKVICLDENSADSYEEVIVYIQEDEDN